tara:strand:- start:1680 stop:2153 length:474 start_codon:yes stop_codon:yes gene_type:complete
MTNRNYLLKYVIKYLSKYDSSKKNLERILKSKIQRITKDKHERFKLYSEITNVLIELENNNLINDENYAQNKIELLISQNKSKNYIKNYLSLKGIEKTIIAEQFEKYENLNLNWEKNSAFNFAKKKDLLNSDIDMEKKLGKMARAGFPYDLCKEILK